jgi:SWI/SNF related-matrix-associated actin-dependent regulator of chromatin subfamily C
VRYHCLKDKKLEICAPCYLDGRFPSTFFSGDFVKLTTSPPGIAGSSSANNDWSDQETLLLLEGVEMYDDDWSKIEEHVGTRTAQQCVRRFLELPIEDPYLQTEGNMGPLRFGRIPFEQADNPVMSVVAFLAGVVNPGVAAEAAKTALKELTDGEGGKRATSGETKSEGERKDENKMDEDVSPSGSTPRESASDLTKGSTAITTTTTTTSTSTTTTHTLPHSQVQRAAHLALTASAKAAQNLATAEDQQIRSTLSNLIKLTLTKLEIKMSQFEELEEILEEERRNLESARVALVNERLGLKKMLDTVRGEVNRHQQQQLAAAAAASAGANGQTSAQQQLAGFSQGVASVAMNTAMPLGTSGQGPIVNEVQSSAMNVEGGDGPVQDGQTLQLS